MDTTADHARARRRGQTGDHVRDGAIGRPVDVAVARDHVYRALAVPARARVDRPYLGHAHTRRASSFRGYATAGIVANVRMCNRVYGVARGFDTYVDYPCNHEVSRQGGHEQLLARRLVHGSRQSAPAAGPRPFPFNVQARAREITSRGGNGSTREPPQREVAAGTARPFFLFLNLMDVHGPYFPSLKRDRKVLDRPVPP